MRADKTEILRSDSVIVQADKSSNMWYKMRVNEYNKKLKDNKSRGTTERPPGVTWMRWQRRPYDLDNRIDIPTEDKAFITIKDHKDSFPSRVECRLIDPPRTALGPSANPSWTVSTPPSGPPRSPTNGRTPAQPLIGSLPSSLSQRWHSSNSTYQIILFGHVIISTCSGYYVY